MQSLYEYYATQDVRPTFADFRDEAQLARYADLRRNVMYRLTIPPAFFDGKRVLEFGPDTGENALVFSLWGARMTLVEPNREAHAYIRAYFSKFGVSDRLEDIVGKSLTDFTTAGRFDVIDAEGFIYTVRPTSAWIEKTAACLEPGGLLIISYMELYGGFMELMHKALYEAIVRTGVRAAGIETARLLFQPKWDSIPHTRAIDSWFMDVIANPFVRLRYFLEPADLLRQTHAGGFRLHSSWPNYRDTLSMSWIKAAYSEEGDLESSIAFIEQSRLSHFLGSKCFLPVPAPDLSGNLRALVEIVDALVDTHSGSACADGIARTDSVLRTLAATMPVASDEELRQAHAILSMISRAFDVLGKQDADALIAFCRSDEVLISNWGMPAHYAVFQKIADLH